MKKLIVCLVLSAFMFLSPNAQTTQQEYNYVTVGYKQDLQSGHPMLTGYSLQLALDEYTITGQNGKWWSTTVYYFKKGSAKKGLAIDCKDNYGNRQFYCIPTHDANSDVRAAYIRAFQTMPPVWKEVMLLTVANITSKELL